MKARSKKIKCLVCKKNNCTNRKCLKIVYGYGYYNENGELKISKVGINKINKK